MPIVERPNILFCLFDSLSVVDWAANCLADSGSPESVQRLSTLSQLCANGTLFNRTYTPCPEGSPARASLFTGLDPSVHGLWTNGVTLADNEQTFSQRLAQAGYTNYLAGRYQLAGLSSWTTEQVRQNEFSQMDWAHGPLHRSRQNAYLVWLQHSAPKHYSRIFTAQADPDNTLATKQQRAALESLPEALSFNYWVGQCVAEWVESQSSEKPFMAIAGFSVGDMLGTEPHQITDGESLNLLALQQADVAIGRILEQLDASNRAQDTVVIVASARGNADSLNAGDALNEKSIRVPLLIYGADFKQQIVDAPISTIDIAPTVMEIASAPIGARMQGRSLLGVLNGSTTPRGWAMSRIRKSLPTEARNWQTVLCADNMKLVVCHDDRQEQGETIKLYNLDTDPLEQNNLAGLDTHAAELEQLIDQMIDARCALEDRTEPRIAEF